MSADDKKSHKETHGGHGHHKHDRHKRYDWNKEMSDLKEQAEREADADRARKRAAAKPLKDRVEHEHWETKVIDAVASVPFHALDGIRRGLDVIVNPLKTISDDKRQSLESEVEELKNKAENRSITYEELKTLEKLETKLKTAPLNSEDKRKLDAVTAAFERHEKNPEGFKAAVLALVEEEKKSQREPKRYTADKISEWTSYPSFHYLHKHVGEKKWRAFLAQLPTEDDYRKAERKKVKDRIVDWTERKGVSLPKIEKKFNVNVYIKGQVEKGKKEDDAYEKAKDKIKKLEKPEDKAKREAKEKMKRFQKQVDDLVVRLHEQALAVGQKLSAEALTEELEKKRGIKDKEILERAHQKNEELNKRLTAVERAMGATMAEKADKLKPLPTEEIVEMEADYEDETKPATKSAAETVMTFEAEPESDEEKKAEADRKAKEDLQRLREELQKKREVDLKVMAEAQERAKLEATKKKAEEEARQLQLETEHKAREEAERLKKEAEEEARAEAERKAKEEADAKATAEEEARLKAEGEARLKAEAEARAKAEEEARLKAEAEAKKKAKKEAKTKAKKEAKKERREQAMAERDTKLKTKREAEEKAKREAEEKAPTELESKKQAEAEALRKGEAAIAAWRKEKEAAAKHLTEEEQQKKIEEEAAKRGIPVEELQKILENFGPQIKQIEFGIPGQEKGWNAGTFNTKTGKWKLGDKFIELDIPDLGVPELHEGKGKDIIDRTFSYTPNYRFTLRRDRNTGEVTLVTTVRGETETNKLTGPQEIIPLLEKFRTASEKALETAREQIMEKRRSTNSDLDEVFNWLMGTVEKQDPDNTIAKDKEFERQVEEITESLRSIEDTKLSEQDWENTTAAIRRAVEALAVYVQKEYKIKV